ncbi:MAG TPA: hypothetical protein VIH48_02990 [Candidatus Bathyarchaeia archaeon]
MYELNRIADLVEEQIVKGGLRWLANFDEIRRNYAIGDTIFPIYASGGLQEKGFILSRAYSALITPRYKIHFLLFMAPQIDPKALKKIILSCKSKFGQNDWIFLGLVQSQPFEKTAKEAITSIDDKTVGIAAFSLASKEKAVSNNVLGKGLAKQLRLTEPKFETFDLPNYVKSFAIIFCAGTALLVLIALSGLPQAVQPLTLLFMTVFSIIAGYRLYKTRYHTTLSLNSKGFTIREGTKIMEGKWSDYTDVAIYITPRHETCLRLKSNDKKVDLPLSRVGLSRKDSFETIRQLIKRK